MAWKAKLIGVDQQNVKIQYYETISNDSRIELYPLSQFSTKQELVDFCQGIVTDLNANLAKYNQLNTALASSINKDVA